MFISLFDKCLVLISFSTLCLPCEVTDSVSNFHRASIIIRDAWSSCITVVRPTCMAKHNFCEDGICKLSFEDWEDMKPSPGCSPSNSSIHRVCRMLFPESCNGALICGTYTWKSKLLILVSVTLSLLLSSPISYNCIFNNMCLN